MLMPFVEGNRNMYEMNSLIPVVQKSFVRERNDIFDKSVRDIMRH